MALDRLTASQFVIIFFFINAYIYLGTPLLTITKLDQVQYQDSYLPTVSHYP